MEESPLQKANYIPVSVLPNILKIFEKLMREQIKYYISNYLYFTCVHKEKDSVHNKLY